ncbi:MAG: signal peptidase I [Candidatus Poribacteria bacterium]
MNISDDSVKPIIYKGPSMNPTLKNLDLLIVVPYGNKRARRGDVITYKAPNREISVTHRIISVDDKGIKTLGDNNDYPDDYILQYEDIIGRVEYAKRKNRKIKIYGGTAGHIYAKIIRTIRWSKKTIMRILRLSRPIYNFFHRSGHLAKFVPKKAKLRTIYYKREDSFEIQLFIGNLYVGRFNNKYADWNIKLPFRLFIKEKDLMEIKEKFLSMSKNQ